MIRSFIGHKCIILREPINEKQKLPEKQKPCRAGGGGEEGAAVPWSLQAVLWSGACPNRYTEDRVADAAAWRAARSVRAGDTVAVRGWPGRTPQGRPSVFAMGVHLVGLASDGILRFGY